MLVPETAAKFLLEDKDFEEATESLENINFLADVVNHINKTDLKIEGVGDHKDPPMNVENLLIHTDDYGGIREWALLGFSNNILRHLKVQIKNLWLCNPPTKIYEDIKKNYDLSIILVSHDLDLVYKYSDRVALIERIIQM